MYIVDTHDQMKESNGLLDPLCYCKQMGRLYSYHDDSTELTGDGVAISADGAPHVYKSNNQDGVWWDGKFYALIHLTSGNFSINVASDTAIQLNTNTFDPFRLYDNSSYEFSVPQKPDVMAWTMDFRPQMNQAGNGGVDAWWEFRTASGGPTTRYRVGPGLYGENSRFTPPAHRTITRRNPGAVYQLLGRVSSVFSTPISINSGTTFTRCYVWGE